MVSLFGCFRRPSASAELSGTLAQTPTGAAAGQPACTVRPQQTEGPYFVDEGLNRSDIRSDPATGSVKPGVPLTLQFRVSQVGANACVPLAGAIVDVWHCDATGAYSDVADRRANTLGQKFLRGAQVTNADGTVEFTTIYPGWYPGRTTHIHFKIRGNTAANQGANQGYEFTSQLYFDDALSDRIYTQAPYSTRGQRTTRNQNDGIFRSGGDQLMLSLTQNGEGYTGRFEIGLELT
ncbi:intradiol ring-cleavage dioxygenase [Phormidium sp. FACHB-322]|nr:intradiol ring-cleavage dioxygenase [Phormidium sp. FACHB-77]MBD2030301.1 intradiol ring-cleavage dioxygenase [Phormidium sp. FACHB-322]MBD2049847.1 intradiol ring-cleavage dioxygenase [Leptolyngbya sp. FACHB-60]